MWFDYLPAVWNGLVVTIEVTLLASLVAILIAFAVGVMRLSRRSAIRWVATSYTEFFRGTSLLVQLFWWYFVLPHFGIFLPAIVVAVMGIGLNLGAYGAEVVRAAIQSVPRSQIEASVALNMSPALRMRRIIIPQALVLMLPPWGNLLIELLKATALVSLITLHDLSFVGQILNATSPTVITLQIFGLVMVVYYLIARGLITPIIRYLERRFTPGLVAKA